MSIRERIAQAMALQLTDGGTTSFETLANAALAEIAKDHVVVPRVPTEAMCKAGADAYCDRFYFNEEWADTTFRAMIEAAGEE